MLIIRTVFILAHLSQKGEWMARLTSLCQSQRSVERGSTTLKDFFVPQLSGNHP